MRTIEVGAALLLLTGAFPLTTAARVNWNTALRHTSLWTALAWLAWVGAAWLQVLRPENGQSVAVYGALCLTACAGIAVLGARRPGAAAWNFVVVGLLAVLLLPILNGWGEPRLEPAHEFFLAVTLLLPFLNYLPTRLGPSVLLAAAGCGWEMAQLMGWADRKLSLGLLFLGVSPWIGWAAVAWRKRATSEFDHLWLAYRDRFGFLWGQRMREQFNRAAQHAGWPVVLHWRGLLARDDRGCLDQAALLDLLRAVLKRFNEPEA